MPLVTIQASNLSLEQKHRIGDQIIRALHLEGIPPVSVVVLFKAEEADIFVDGGMVSEATAPSSHPAPSPNAGFPQADHLPRTRLRKQEQGDLKAQLVHHLRTRGALSSFQAQDALGLSASDGAPALLRRFFGELEAEGAIAKEGQRRGTRYVWLDRARSASEAPAQSEPGAADSSDSDEEA